MQRAGLAFVMGLCALLGCLASAQAKEFAVGPYSRAAVKSACDRARGFAVGTADPESEYGCSTQRAKVRCTADGSQCVAVVPDTLPMTGTGLDLVLGSPLARSGQPTRILPENAHIGANP
jgi:hypothetical protein